MVRLNRTERKGEEREKEISEKKKKRAGDQTRKKEKGTECTTRKRKKESNHWEVNCKAIVKLSRCLAF